MTPLEITCLTFLERCAASTFGIVARVEEAGAELTVTPALRAKQVLYRIRKEIGNPQFDNIRIDLSPDDPDRELWLINMPEGRT
jgi:hypothetical protein